MQIIIVIAILAVVLFFAIRKLVRLSKGKDSACACGCDNCPMKCGNNK